MNNAALCVKPYAENPHKRCHGLTLTALAMLCAVGHAHAVFAGVLSASNYVQSGLIAHWDGLENAGSGKHESGATVWKDLSGKGNDLTCTSGNYSWGEKWFYANAHGSGVVESAKANKAITNYQTIEIVFRSDSGKDGKRGIVCSGNKSKVHYLIYANKVLQMAESQPALALPDMFADTTAAATYASGTATAASSVFLNGKSQTASTYSETWGTYPSVFSVAYGKTAGYAFCGRIYAIRLYDRVLTAVELRANAKRDGIRFFGKEPSPGLSILIR